jgi:hypothetical protein
MTATKKNIPGKRIKTWHRHYRDASTTARMPLRAFARALAANGNDSEKAAALAWAGGKVAP